MYPVGGGGTDGGFPDGGNTRPIDARLVDAKVIDGAPAAVDANLFQGRVCLLTDPRKFTTCATTGADGLTVRIGSATATTAADGTFTIAGTSAANLPWRVTGANIVSSYKVLADYQIPAMTRTMYNSLLTTNNVLLVPGEGSLMVHVVRNGLGYAGAVAESQLPNDAYYLPFYDSAASATDWNQTPDTVGAEGAVWLAGMDVGNTSVKITPPTGAPITDTGEPIYDDGITWSDVIFN